MKNIPGSSKDWKSQIQKQAYLLSEKSSFTIKPDEAWVEAEKQIRNRTFNQDLSNKEFYGCLAKDFFSSVDIHSMSDEEIGMAYIKSSYGRSKELFKSIIHLDKTFSNLNHVSVLLGNSDIKQLSKKTLFLSESTLFGHAGSGTKIVENIFADKTYDYHTDICTNCPDISNLGGWLRSSKNLLELGDLFYLPSISEVHSQGAEFKSSTDELLFDAIATNNKAIKPTTNNPLKNELIHVISEIELPYIGNTSYEDLCKISFDEHQHLEKFRDFFLEKFMDLSEKSGSEYNELIHNKINHSIKKGLKQISRDTKTLTRKTAIISTGAVMSTVMATLIAINANAFEAIGKIIGYSGGTMAFANIIASHLSNKYSIQDSPYYFVWLINEKIK